MFCSDVRELYEMVDEWSGLTMQTRHFHSINTNPHRLPENSMHRNIKVPRQPFQTPVRTLQELFINPRQIRQSILHKRKVVIRRQEKGHRHLLLSQLITE